MKKEHYICIIVILLLILVISACEIKYNLTDYIQGINRGSWKQIGSDQGTNNTLGVSRLHVINEIPYLLYINNINDLSSDDDVIIVKRYNNDIWQNISGFPSIPAKNSGMSPVSMTSNNNVFVSYIDQGNTFRLVRYNFGSWTEIGNLANIDSAVNTSFNNFIYTAFRDNGSGQIRAIDPSGGEAFLTGNSPSISYYTSPVIAYVDDTSNDIDVRGYNSGSNNWDLSINNIIPAAIPSSLSIRGQGNNLYICYGDAANNIYVQKYNISLNTWEEVGGTGYTFTNAQMYHDKSLAVYGNYVYLAYSETLNSNRVTVKRCGTNGNWETVGETGFTSHGAYNISIQISNGIPFISYHKNSSNGKIVVMKYD